MLNELFDELLFGSEVVRFNRFVQVCERAFHSLGKLLVYVPASFKICILLTVIEIMTDCEKKYYVVAISVTLRHMLKNDLLGDDATERVNSRFEVLESFGLCSIDIRFPNSREAVVLYLTNALTGYVVFFSDSVQRATLPFWR